MRQVSKKECFRKLLIAWENEELFNHIKSCNCGFLLPYKVNALPPIPVRTYMWKCCKELNEELWSGRCTLECFLDMNKYKFVKVKRNCAGTQRRVRSKLRAKSNLKPITVRDKDKKHSWSTIK